LPQRAPKRETDGLSLRHSLAGRPIARMNGAGNKILVLDLRGLPLSPSPEDARAIHRAPGLNYDQMMVLSDPKTGSAAAYVRIYNNDGTLAEACGNGARCVADRLCRELGLEAVDVETGAGRIVCERLGPWVYRVDMGAPRLEWEAIPLARPADDTRRVDLGWPEGDALSALGPASVVNMGNPHAVFFVPDLARVDAAGWGARIEVHPIFPQKANITFAEIEARDRVTARVWERGVGLTLACGSAACATLVAASRLGLMERKGTVRLPGGELIIEWRAADDHVLMTGPVQFEGERVLDDALFEAAL
jgi:diaminopimelate epimerase